MTDDPFVTHRSLLFTVAYELLGSAADAEDVVQETWLRWADVDQAEVHDPRAYLVRMVTRQALNRLRSVSRRREEYVGEWLPEPLLTSPDVAEDAELAENVSIAMLTVLETLGPADRAPCPRARRGAAAADAGGPNPAAGRRREVHGRHLHRRRAGPGGGARPGRGVDLRRRRPGGGCSEANHRSREGGGGPGPRGEVPGHRGDHRLAQREAGRPDRRRWRSRRGEPGGRGRSDHPDLRDRQPAQAGMAGKGGGTAAVTVLRLRHGS